MSIGINVREFWDLTWKEFMICILGYEKKQIDAWHHTRQICYTMYLCNTADKSPKSPETFMPLPGDKVSDRGRPLSEEEFLRTLQLYGDGNGGNIKN